MGLKNGAEVVTEVVIEGITEEANSEFSVAYTATVDVDSFKVLFQVKGFNFAVSTVSITK